MSQIVQQPLLTDILRQSIEFIPYEQWLRDEGGATFDPSGVAVLVSRQKAEELDEYAGGDPYGGEQSRLTEFYKWRLASVLRLMKGHVVSGHRVLDIGSGPGHMTEAIAARFPDVWFVGVDGSRTAVKNARSLANGCYCVADAVHLPFADGSVNGVLMMNIWEHVTDPISMAKDARRVLSPGGWLIVSTPSRYRTENLVQVACGGRPRFRSCQHVTEYSVGQVLEQLRWAGFCEAHVFDTTNFWLRRGSRLRRWIGGSLTAWKHIVGSHHVFGPTAFVFARRS